MGLYVKPRRLLVCLRQKPLLVMGYPFKPLGWFVVLYQNKRAIILMNYSRISKCILKSGCRYGFVSNHYKFVIVWIVFLS